LLKHKLTDSAEGFRRFSSTLHWQYGGATQEQSATYRYSALVPADE
jgi:hypothetical protein